jgi:hypothetical protein
MKKYNTIVFIALFINVLAYGQNNTEFFKSYRLSSTLWERCESINILQNGNYIDIGESSHCNGVSTCNNSCSFIWFDKYGNMIRNKKIGSSSGFYGVEIAECNDHSLIAHGNVSNNLMFLKTDNTGNVIWSKTIDHVSDMNAKDLVQIDTIYFVNGSLGYNASQIYSFTESGNFRWMKSLVAADRIQVKAITKSYNKSLIGIAQLTNTTSYYGAAALFEMDVNGNILNSKIITPSFTKYTRESAFNICKTSDGNFIACYALSNGGYFMIKINSALSILWSVNITANPLFGSGYRDVLTADNAGGVWIGSHSQYSKAIELIHISSNGSLLEKNTYSNNDLIELSGMSYTSDCNLLIGGARRDGIVYSHFLAALGKDGKTNCIDSLYNVSLQPITFNTQAYTISMANEIVTVSNISLFQEIGDYQEINYCSATADNCNSNSINDFTDENDISVFPQPAENLLQIRSKNSNPIQFSLYNELGIKIMYEQFNTDISNLDISVLSRGIYFYSISSGNDLLKTGKIIKQ